MQHVTPQEEFRYTLCCHIIFTASTMFSDETPFHLPEHNLHNIRIVGSNNPHAVAQETARDGPKIKVFFILSKEISSGPSFLPKAK